MSDRQQAAVIRLVRELLLSLPNLARAGWGNRGVPLSLNESVAAHSFGVAMLAIFLAVFEKANPERASLLANLHDILEAETGDLTPRVTSLLEELGISKDQLEAQAEERREQNLPRPLRDLLREASREFNEGRTLEARVARDADILQRGIQGVQYAAQGFDTSEIVDRTRELLTTETAIALWNQIFQ
ncbi:MAG: HD domain-containing protein [Candidatus Wildermuthbacteria bacterium]|nr:HD domain-containing protein [Candidatus Wildermuthbacteria bacterium]